MADQAVIVTRLQRFAENENGRFTHGVAINFDDINDASFTTQGDTVSVEFTGGDLPTEYAVGACMSYVKTAFATTGTLTYQVGTDGDPNNYLADTTALTAGPLVSAIGCSPLTLAGSFGTAGDDLMVRFTSQAATGAPADITAGKLIVFWEILDLDAMSLGL